MLLAETKIHGGKTYLCNHIHDLAPTGCENFADLFGGAGSVTYNAPRYVNQLYNDKNYDRWNVKDQIKCNHLSLMDALGRLDYSPKTFREFKAQNVLSLTSHGRAVRYIVTNRMSRGGLGNDFAWSDRIRGGLPGDLHAWQQMIKRLPLLNQRLQSVALHCREAKSLLRDSWSHRDWIYADPPYMKVTRTSGNEYGDDEMSDEDHVDLLVRLLRSPAKVSISGYHSPLYDAMLNEWRLVEFDMPNNSGQGKVKQRRIECLWMNY